MPATKDQAIVLRRLDYSETSQVLVFFTRLHGPQHLIAKGIKRGTKNKFSTGIDLLEQGRLVFLAKTESRQGLGTLTEWHQTNAYLGLRQNIQRWYCGQYAAEITAALTEVGDPHPVLFDDLTQLLDSLCTSEIPLPLLIVYQCALLTEVGLWPDLTRCVICDRTAPQGRSAYYAAHQGGLICSNCQSSLTDKRKISAPTLNALRQRNFNNKSAGDAFDVLNHTISNIINRPPALAKFIRTGK
ncbi:MAG: DNA repair protein RecO [Planctomycetota bacterium]|jgi:DNA repair protein RecO (recombination protein O)